jgi:type IV secretory pathway TrbD component
MSTLLEIDKRHILKQFAILNGVAGFMIAFILVTIIAAKFFLTIGFTVALVFVCRAINKKGLFIRNRIK